MNFLVNVRDRRQVTIPREILEGLGLNVGDKLSINLIGDEAKLKPAKQAALDSLKSIQQAFKNSGVSKEEILKSGGRIRKRLAEKRYGKKQ